MAGLLEDQVADKLGEFACPHGCGATHSYSEWPAHILVCPKTPIACPCWQKGPLQDVDKFSSEICTFSGSLAELREHVRTHCHLGYDIDRTTINIKRFKEAVTDAGSLPAHHPYYDDIVHGRDYNHYIHCRLPIPATMRMIDGERQTWKLEQVLPLSRAPLSRARACPLSCAPRPLPCARRLAQVYGMIYGYSMYIGGLLITFFTSLKDNDNVCASITPHSV